MMFCMPINTICDVNIHEINWILVFEVRFNYICCFLKHQNINFKDVTVIFTIFLGNSIISVCNSLKSKITKLTGSKMIHTTKNAIFHYSKLVLLLYSMFSKKWYHRYIYIYKYSCIIYGCSEVALWTEPW